MHDNTFFTLKKMNTVSYIIQTLNRYLIVCKLKKRMLEFYKFKYAAGCCIV